MPLQRIIQRRFQPAGSGDGASALAADVLAVCALVLHCPPQPPAPDPGQRAQHRWYLVCRGLPSPPPRLRAGQAATLPNSSRQAATLPNSIVGGWLKSAICILKHPEDEAVRDSQGHDGTFAECSIQPFRCLLSYKTTLV